MAKKEVDLGKISMNPNASGSLRRHSIGEVISSSSSVSSTSNEKPLPHYMKASTSSCHDICKYGQRHEFESESTRPFRQKSSKKTLRGKPPQGDKLNLVEGRKMCEIKLNSSSHAKNEAPGKLAMNKLKSASTQQSCISIDHEIPSASDTKETQVKGTNLGDQTKKQVIETKTVAKSNSFSNKHKVDDYPSPSPDKGIDAVQKSGIIKKNVPLLEANSSTKLAKKTSLKNHTQDALPNPKHRSSVPEEMNKVDAKFVATRRVSKTPSVAPGSPLVSPRESIGHRKNKKKIINSREITKTPEKKMPEPSMASPSLKHVGDGISSLKQRKHKDGEEATPIKDPMVEKFEHDTENNEEKTLQVIVEVADKVDTDSTEQKSLEMEKVLSAELLIKCEVGDLDSLQQKLLKPENADMGIPEKNINLDSHDLNPNGQKLLEVKNDNTILLDQNVLNPEKVDIDSLELRPDCLKLLELENDINYQEKNLPKLEQLDFESLELEPTNQNLLGLENGKTDVLEQKLLKPEDLDLDLLEQKFPEQGNADMNSSEQKLLELEGVDLDSLVLEHYNRKLLEKEDANMNSLAQKLPEPEVIGLDSLVLKHSDQKLAEQENAEMNSLEKKLPEPQDMDLDSLELKHNDQKLLEQANIDMNSVEQNMLKPVNIDLDSPDHDHLSKLATDEDEEIEESESSSEPAESEHEHGVKEVEGDCEPLKTEERRTARRNSVVHPEDNTSGPHKLKFRRGKTIELQAESNGPRRLRFRRRRTVDVSVDSMNIERKNFQRSEMTEAVPISGPEAQSIVLKHQGAQEKKDAKGLFNNVIEETASKLVETRKSKVKALVGAFETVISLQDGKQESTT